MKIVPRILILIILAASCTSKNFSGIYRLHSKFTGPMMPVNTRITVDLEKDSTFKIRVKQLKNDFEDQKWEALEAKGKLINRNDSLIVISTLLKNPYIIVENKYMVPAFRLNENKDFRMYKASILRK